MQDPPCSVSDGSSANSAACACGSVDCESLRDYRHALLLEQEPVPQDAKHLHAPCPTDLLPTLEPVLAAV